MNIVIDLTSCKLAWPVTICVFNFSLLVDCKYTQSKLKFSQSLATVSHYSM